MVLRIHKENALAKVIVFGGAGYCGSVLVPQLVQKGHQVTIFDTFWYADEWLDEIRNDIKKIRGDVRDIDKVAAALDGQDQVVHLACISNDASFDLDESLSTSVNLDCFEPLVEHAKSAGVQRFIFASSSSVYGISDHPDVTEEHPLLPVSLYNKYKGMCEPLLLKHTDSDFIGTIFRPATVCGYGPRQRLDVSVNILTNFGFNKKEIKVFGGDQMRPNLHIKDYCRAVHALMDAPNELVANEIFNVGTQNMTINDIAQTVKNVIEKKFPELGEISIVRTESDDKRSYHINSEKIKRVLNFEPQFSVEDAVADLCDAFMQGKLPNSFDDDKYYNIRTMKKLAIK